MRLPAHDVRQAVLFQFLQHVVQFDWKVAIRGVVSFRFTSPVIRQATPVLVAVHNLSWVWLVDVVTRHGGTAKERFDSLQQEENKSEAFVAFVTLELLVLTVGLSLRVLYAYALPECASQFHQEEEALANSIEKAR